MRDWWCPLSSMFYTVLAGCLVYGWIKITQMAYLLRALQVLFACRYNEKKVKKNKALQTCYIFVPYQANAIKVLCQKSLLCNAYIAKYVFAVISCVKTTFGSNQIYTLIELSKFTCYTQIQLNIHKNKISYNFCMFDSAIKHTILCTITWCDLYTVCLLFATPPLQL